MQTAMHAVINKLTTCEFWNYVEPKRKEYTWNISYGKGFERWNLNFFFSMRKTAFVDCKQI